jgi:hypothetical protein
VILPGVLTQDNMLAAYIDESGNSELFTLSCLVAAYGAWVWFEMDWKTCLDKTNASLVRQGRKPITRYHAADCSSRLNEFEGWTQQEQVSLFTSLLGVFHKHITNTIAFTISLKELSEEIPTSADDPKRSAYVLLLKYLMIEIGNNILARENWQLVSIVHDRTDAYNRVLLDTFNAMLSDNTFRYRDRFTSITPMSWQDSIPLQAADLLAYENFKEVERQTRTRSRRKSLEALLGLTDTFGGKCVSIPRQGIREIKAMLDAEKQEAAK